MLVKSGPEVSFADFEAVKSRVDAAVSEVQGARDEVKALRDKEVKA